MNVFVTNPDCYCDQSCDHGHDVDCRHYGCKCSCDTGWTGSCCSDNIDDCQGKSCNNGTCIDGVVSYNCSCDAGYTGATCDAAQDILDNPYSKERSKSIVKKAVDNYYKAQTTSSARLYSSLRFLSTNNLLWNRPHPSLASVNTSSQVISRLSTKLKLLTGTYYIQSNKAAFNQNTVDPTCLLYKDYECHSSPCLNGGTCTDYQKAGYTCHCPLGFTGKNCEQDPVVLIKPSIILPESKIIPEGYSVLTIPCYAEGIPVPNITWESLDKQSIPQNARQLAHYLVIRNVSKDDGGHYMCTAKNKIGTDIKVVQIIVRAISEKQIAPLIHAPSYVEVKYYLEGRLTCNVTGFPTPIVIWRHNNNVVQSTGKTLVIQRVTNATTGIYTCIAKNHAGTSQANIQLKVTYDTPKIITPPITSVIMAGKSHNFSCIATGHPTPTIKWTYRMYIKHTTDMPSHQIHNHGSVLTLYTIDTQESGQLTCTAQNEFREEHVSVSVIVRNSNPVG
ncbi:Hypothetical predicted protein [Mytilus galloprovincialis]|uniref:Uncharacterized protein n=1 Tax=Mytilus galloprovincialis TaxID=29158 RepID=A0A8B6ELX9_MYTGA|nr:Hypothetical predicted protein [Mytilus galloprovincialis]